MEDLPEDRKKMGLLRKKENKERVGKCRERRKLKEIRNKKRKYVYTYFIKGQAFLKAAVDNFPKDQIKIFTEIKGPFGELENKFSSRQLICAFIS